MSRSISLRTSASQRAAAGLGDGLEAGSGILGPVLEAGLTGLGLADGHCKTVCEHVVELVCDAVAFLRGVAQGPFFSLSGQQFGIAVELVQVEPSGSCVASPQPAGYEQPDEGQGADESRPPSSTSPSARSTASWTAIRATTGAAALSSRRRGA